MFNFNAESVIQMLVDAGEHKKDAGIVYHDDYSYSRNALYVRFSVNVHDCQADESEYAMVHMIFTGNTSVYFFADRENKYFNMPPVEEFVNTSNHSSCRRSDGFRKLTELYFDMCKAVNPHAAPCELSSQCYFSFFKKEVINITYKSAPGDDYGYNLVSIQGVPDND